MCQTNLGYVFQNDSDEGVNKPRICVLRRIQVIFNPLVELSRVWISQDLLPQAALNGRQRIQESQITLCQNLGQTFLGSIRLCDLIQQIDLK